MYSSFKLTQAEDLEYSCAILYRKLNDSVYESLESAPENPEYAIHQIRKILKMIRSLIKMSKCGLSTTHFEEANYHYRNIGRMLSDIRDSHSRRVLLKNLSAESNRSGMTPLFEELIEINARQIENLEQIHLHDFNIFDRVRRKLDSPLSHTLFTDFNLNTGTLINGISGTYESGFNAFFTSLLSSSPDLLHEWRKRLKDLQSQASYIKDIAGLSPHVDLEEIDELAELLGDYHDLDLLKVWFQNLTLNASFDESVESLNSFVKLKQDKILRKAEYLGKSIYRLEPEKFGFQLQVAFPRQ